MNLKVGEWGWNRGMGGRGKGGGERGEGEGEGGGEGQIKEDRKSPSLQCRWWEEEEMGKHFAILHNICNGKRINRGELPLKGWKPLSPRHC